VLWPIVLERRDIGEILGGIRAAEWEGIETIVTSATLLLSMLRLQSVGSRVK
jgi:hypothetical protein